MDKLKPCAFCGSYNSHLNYHHDSLDNIKLYTINCAECNARTGIYDKLSAIKAWNARSTDEYKAKVIDAVSNILIPLPTSCGKGQAVDIIKEALIKAIEKVKL